MQGSDADKLGKVDDEDNDGERKDEGADRPGRSPAGAGGAVSREKEVKRAAPGCRQKAPCGGQGTKKAGVAPKQK